MSELRVPMAVGRGWGVGGLRRGVCRGFGYRWWTLWTEGQVNTYTEHVLNLKFSVFTANCKFIICAVTQLFKIMGAVWG